MLYLVDGVCRNAGPVSGSAYCRILENHFRSCLQRTIRPADDSILSV